MKNRQALYLLLFLLFCSCQKDEYMKGFEYKLVVDGWIEEGDVAHVILTQTKPIFSEIDSVDIEEMAIKWAKITVSDGESSEVLSRKIDPNYFPPFVYRGSLIRGETGKKYTLKIEYSDRIWEAETYIPKSVDLKQINTESVSETLFSIEAHFDDPVSEKNFYKLYTQIENSSNPLTEKPAYKQVRYMASFIGTFNDNLFNGESILMKVNKGISLEDNGEYSPNFTIGDTVWVKFCTLPKIGFQYWSLYENETINGQNPFFPANRSLPTNISNQGIGLWCGYGKRVYQVTYP